MLNLRIAHIGSLNKAVVIVVLCRSKDWVGAAAFWAGVSCVWKPPKHNRQLSIMAVLCLEAGPGKPPLPGGLRRGCCGVVVMLPCLLVPDLMAPLRGSRAAPRHLIVGRCTSAATPAAAWLGYLPAPVLDLVV